MIITSFDQLKALSQPERLRAFVDWLGTQPRETLYYYGDCTNCAMCMFGRALGLYKATAGGTYIRDSVTWQAIHIVGAYVNLNVPNDLLALQDSTTLGQLYDSLRLLVGPSDGELERIEARPLLEVDTGPLLEVGAVEAVEEQELTTI